MNKKELISKLSEKTGMKQDDVNTLLSEFIDTVTDTLKSGDNVALVNFGTFEVVDKAARKSATRVQARKFRFRPRRSRASVRARVSRNQSTARATLLTAWNRRDARFTFCLTITLCQMGIHQSRRSRQHMNHNKQKPPSLAVVFVSSYGGYSGRDVSIPRHPQTGG
jgi:nucleoid DNA-binding protein